MHVNIVCVCGLGYCVCGCVWIWIVSMCRKVFISNADEYTTELPFFRSFLLSAVRTLNWVYAVMARKEHLDQRTVRDLN